MDQWSGKYEINAIARYVRLNDFAYSSWVYEAFKGELSRMFSYDGRVREHEICENILVMPIWTCQAAKVMLVVWRKKSTEQKDLNPRKTFQLDIESVFILIFVH